MTKPMVHFVLLLIAIGLFSAESKLECTSSQYCAEKLRPGSECVDGFCSNPFVDGCFKTMLGSKDQEDLEDMNVPSEILGALNGRVCNSDDLKDDVNDDSAFCLSNEFDYFEIRIHNGNWESSIFFAWIMQIILMEVLKVPATIGLNSGVTNVTSFYSPVNTIEYSSAAYPWAALRQSSYEASGCETTDEDCVDILPEVWNSQLPEWTALMQEGTIDALDWCGQVGKLGWYIPTLTAERDSSLVSHYGLKGEKNRAKLAETFKRPTTWVEYCEEVSTTNCTEPDEVADSYPDVESKEKYFVKGNYTGFFRLLPENDCAQFPDTCTGYMVAPPCSWSTNVDSQLYWNNIVGIATDGPLTPNGGYGYSSMIEIWNAANATRSNVMVWWWQPEALLEKFSGTGFGFQQVLLPTVTKTCIKSRVSNEERCSSDIMVRRGDPMGACDQESHALLKILSSTLPDRTIAVDETSRSPGYSFARSLKVTDYEIQAMLNDWIEMEVDTYGNDAREVVCSWVVDNVDILIDFIPPGHPRILDEQGSFQQAYVYFAMVVSVLCLLSIMGVAFIVHKYRDVKVFVYAQEVFVKIIMFGFLLVAVGGFIYTFEPTNGTCIARSWLTNIGFSTVLSVVMVKMSTINRIMQKSKKCKRIKVSRRAMFGSVGVLVLIDAIILAVWTGVSPPQAIQELILPKEIDNTVQSSVICRSKWIVFEYIIVGWHFLLLLVASVLSFQSRDIVPAFNESKSIGTMIYSNFLFMIIRMIVFALGNSRLIQPNFFGASMCLLFVLDTLIATTIYIVPKCFEARKNPATHVTRGSLVVSGTNNGANISSGSGFSSNFGVSGQLSTSSIPDSSEHPSERRGSHKSAN